MDKPKIIIVEDESVVALDIQMLLERLGYEVLAVIARGEEVVPLVQTRQPDLILMDIHLDGEMDGIEAANQLRPLYPNLPVIFLTAYVDEPILQRASVTGSFGYILKPFEEHELNANIQMALYKAQFAETLSNHEAYFRALIDNSTDIVSIIDLQGKTRFVSSPIYEILGYSAEELIGQNAVGLVHPEDREKMLSELQSGMDGNGSKTSVQFRFRHKNGSWRTLEVRTNVQTQNPVIAGIIVNARDITERAEIAEALRVERDKAQKYLNTAQVILLVLNEAGEVTLINPYGLDILGYQEQEILGKNWFELCVPVDIREEIRNWHAAILSEAVDRGAPREYPVLTRQREIRHVAWHGVPLTSDGGHVTSILFSGEHVTARLVAEERLRYNAFHDPLTGLPNRSFFLDRLASSIHWASENSTRRFAVLFLDLDSFKLVNDSLGHTVGDKLLVAIARRLESCVRSNDVIARMSGDEFFILLDQIWSPADATQVAEAILKELQKPLVMDYKTFRVTCSIGIVLCNERNQFVEDIIRDADIAMYQAKARGKANYAFFIPDMRTQPLARLKLENVLRDAVEQKYFTLNYQPILSLQDDRLIGFEALLRWKHPEQGVISPVEFIPVLEETGLIIPVGEWILKQVGQRIQDWQALVPSDPPLSISINVSGRQFTHPVLIENVRQLLSTTGLDPQSLKVELTESVLLNDTELARTVLYRLKDMGVQVHIDDFGTGYSSLSYLRTLPFDAIKIDRSFINQIDTEKNQLEIVKSILALANTIGASTVAEGIETETQLECLKSLDCQFGQGYFISHPLDGSRADAFLSQYKEKYSKQTFWYKTSQQD